MKLPNKYILIGLLGILVFFVYPYIRDARRLRDQTKTALVLKESEHEKIVIRGRTMERVRRVSLPDGTTGQVVIRKVGVRKYAISVGKDGGVDVYALQRGPTFEPGFSIGFSGNTVCAGLDVELYYWNKWAVGMGVDTDGQNLRVHGGVFRDLYFDYFNNCSLYLGVDHKSDLRLNFRIRFGDKGE